MYNRALACTTLIQFSNCFDISHLLFFRTLFLEFFYILLGGFESGLWIEVIIIEDYLSTSFAINSSLFFNSLLLYYCCLGFVVLIMFVTLMTDLISLNTNYGYSANLD